MSTQSKNVSHGNFSWIIQILGNEKKMFAAGLRKHGNSNTRRLAYVVHGKDTMHECCTMH